jgi:uncharacterized protein (DUF362 family)
MTRIFTNSAIRLTRLIFEQLQESLGRLKPKRILLKPNWVLHETDPAVPIKALVTDARVIEATADACLQLFPDAESILIGDCPLQYANWPLLCDQSGLTPVIERFNKAFPGKVSFRDLRKEVFLQTKEKFMVRAEAVNGDPAGYREVSLGKRSHLEPISAQADRFAVNDYSASVTSSNHRRGTHHYFVSQSVLDADLIINLPKWKTHAKSGITCALKNLVGVNGDKAYLPHFRRGAPKWDGDEYRDEGRWLYWTQTTLREKLQKRSRMAYAALKPGWELIKKLYRIETRLDDPAAHPKNFYVAGGAWHGNDTIWRMIYDLNLVIQCTDNQGVLHHEPRRHYFCIVDGFVSGEGNGPLQALPRETNWLICGSDPFAIDAALCHFMGFDAEKVPIIAQRRQYAGLNWGQFELSELEVEMDGKRVRIADCPINFHFVPPPGWRNHVER